MLERCWFRKRPQSSDMPQIGQHAHMTCSLILFVAACCHFYKPGLGHPHKVWWGVWQLKGSEWFGSGGCSKCLSQNAGGYKSLGHYTPWYVPDGTCSVIDQSADVGLNHKLPTSWRCTCLHCSGLAYTYRTSLHTAAWLTHSRLAYTQRPDIHTAD